ncbi:unnamed protein product [Mucor circinelloides]
MSSAEQAAINEAVVPTMIEEFADDQVTTFKVTSFTSEHIKYGIAVENEAMMSCTCQDFQWSKTVCKHMFFLKRLHTNVSLYQSPHSLPPREMMLLDQQSQADSPVQLQEAPRSHQNQAMRDVENILAMLNNYKRNPWALTDEQIEQLRIAHYSYSKRSMYS